ncbi:uncharacterized protein IL334_002472 [Kwoniella shivajii]|uniref:CUE domain-containing protein n=1 Tax=Kwoniella shivajii TaxID=564305 RepID=A0ABZ1CUU1_9TREE|nr:hypothetical protein IL334_002472 [Kwoniella shivajii]
MAVPSPSASRVGTGIGIGLTRSPAGNYLSSTTNGNNNNFSKLGSSSSSSNDNLSSGSTGERGLNQGDYMVRSSSGLSSISSTSIPVHPGIGRRRSTDASTSGGLDYYWSSLAGAGASSSSSSLAGASAGNGISSSHSSRSNMLMGISPVTSHFEKDSRNVGDLRNEEFLSNSKGTGMSFSPSSSESLGIHRHIREAKSTGNLRSNHSQDHYQNHHQNQIDFSYKINSNPMNEHGRGHDQKTPRQPDFHDPSDPHPYSQSHSQNHHGISQPIPKPLTTQSLDIPVPPPKSSQQVDLSPGGYSVTSVYSNTDSLPPNNAINPSSSSSASYLGLGHQSAQNAIGDESENETKSISSSSNYSPMDFRIPGKFDFELDENSLSRFQDQSPIGNIEEKRGLMDPSLLSETSQHVRQLQSPQDQAVQQEENRGREGDARSSVQSTSTYRHQSNLTPSQDDEDTYHKTPLAPVQKERSQIRPPQLSLNQEFHTIPLSFSQSNTNTNSRHASPTNSAGSTSTPKRSPNPKSSSSGNHYTSNSSARSGLGFDMPHIGSGSGYGSVSRSSSVSPSDQSSSYSQDNDSNPAPPRSAPAEKNGFDEFGTRNEETGTQEDEEETIKSRNKRTTLPAIASKSSGAIVEALLSPSKENLLSPDKYARNSTSTPTKDLNGSVERRGSTPSPNRSPEPPPRSVLRQLPNATNIDTFMSKPPSQRSSSPQSISHNLPVITHTPHSPMPSPDRSKAQQDRGNIDKPQPKRPDRSPDRQYSPVFPSSATINDLTDILGGAIDAIGLIDSRDTPPPTIGEPSRREKPTMLKLAPAAEVADRGPMTPTSLPQRGTSLPGPTMSSTSLNTIMHPQAQTGPPLYQPQGISSSNQPLVHGRRSTQPELRSKASSIFSFSSKEQIQSPTLSISVRPWPAAMLYGNIKSLKHAGDRAKGYAKAINELSRSESGLKEWCIASVSQVNRAPTKTSAFSSLGVRANSVPSAIPLPYQLSTFDPTPHNRNVSAGSEFPMRADSYAAREISQRVLDPEDQPTSLPPNLPYPQLQANYLSSNTGISSGGGGGFSGGGLKPSQSMQSVASFATTSSKKGFFSAIGRKGAHKKDSLSLGPPGPGGFASATNGSSSSSSSVGKKDVRGLPISGPSPNAIPLDTGIASASGGSGGALQAPRVQNSISAPMGPRNPRMGSFTPPPPSSLSSMDRSSNELVQAGRASLDTGLRNRSTPASLSLNNSRGSLDIQFSTNNTGSGNVPLPSSKGFSNSPIPKEGDVKQMIDILPHVERSVIRTYLGKYGDSMNAIGAYLEDEKNGTVIR